MVSRSNVYQDLQELLIKPIDRVGFITKFWLLTVAGELFITYLCYKAVPIIYTSDNLVASTIIGIFVGCIIGIFIGAIAGWLQYFFLRRYLIREWIIAVVVTLIAYSVYTILVLLWFTHDAYHPPNMAAYNIAPIWFWLNNNYLLILFVILFLIQGAVQWLVFQSYLKKVNWWLVFPLAIGFVTGFQYMPIALGLWLLFKRNLRNIQHFFYYLLVVKVLSSTIFNSIAVPYLLDSNNLGFWFDWICNILTAAAIQAIAICYLRKQERSNLSLDRTSALVATGDLNWQPATKSIINKLTARINNVWQQELDCRFSLTYWLAVNLEGTVVAYHPVDRVSEENLALTPLPQLIGDPNSAEPTAKLQVVFTPPAILELKPLSGISLPMLTIAILSLIYFVAWIAYSIIAFNLLPQLPNH